MHKTWKKYVKTTVKHVNDTLNVCFDRETHFKWEKYQKPKVDVHFSVNTQQKHFHSLFAQVKKKEQVKNNFFFVFYVVSVEKNMQIGCSQAKV